MINKLASAMYEQRFYRENSTGSGRFSTTLVTEGESDILLCWNFHPEKGAPGKGAIRGKDRVKEIQGAAGALLHSIREEIRDYGSTHPDFLEVLEPLGTDSSAPAVVRSMLAAGKAAGTGPMAAVAGAIAEELGLSLQEQFPFRELVIENGGDYWLYIAEPLTVSVYAGLSSLSNKIGIVIEPGLSPCGLACSSGTVGPSLSFGKADAALVLAPNAAAADAWATALGNRIRRREELEQILTDFMNEAAAGIDPGELRPSGALAILGDTLAAAGKIRLGPVQDTGRI